MEASLLRKLQTPFCRSSSNFMSSHHPIAKYTKKCHHMGVPLASWSIALFFCSISAQKDQMEKHLDFSFPQATRSSAFEPECELPRGTPCDGEVFVYVEVFQSLSSLLGNSCSPLVRYFCGTSDTSNTANASDASKSSASVTRLSSYCPWTHLWFLLSWLYNSTSDELSIFDWYLGTQRKVVS